MRKFDEKRKKTVEKLNLPESCIYCKGLGFNCSSCKKFAGSFDDNLIKETDIYEIFKRLS